MAALPDKSGSDVVKRITSAIKTWEELCPDQVFAERTLDQFKEIVKPSLDARAKLATLDTQWQNTMAERATADPATLEALLRLANAVKAHPKFGDNSGMYTALGYIPRSQRSTGLTRRREKEAAKPSTDAQ